MQQQVRSSFWKDLGWSCHAEDLFFIRIWEKVVTSQEVRSSFREDLERSCDAAPGVKQSLGRFRVQCDAVRDEKQFWIRFGVEL